MRYLTAEHIYDGLGNDHTDHVLITQDDGTIEEIVPRQHVSSSDVQPFSGALCPGFVNAHCHVELSHMKAVIPSGTGLVPFLIGVVTQRHFKPDVIGQAIHHAMEEMHGEGIVALGDICNTTDSMKAKLSSNIRTYNFVECFDLFQTNVPPPWQQFLTVYKNFTLKEGDRKSLVPHAPYSVSLELFQRINAHNQTGTSVSIHNQETADENLFALEGSGALTHLYQALNLPLDHYLPPQTSSLVYVLTALRPGHRVILVHNTMTTQEDIKSAEAYSGEVFWCSCPNANLYIENRLPHYSFFTESNAPLCLGTDSLSSNWQLSILEEIKTLKKYVSHLPLKTLIQWGTLNGARALGFEETLGSFEKGKKPGINTFPLSEGEKIPGHAKVKKLM